MELAQTYYSYEVFDGEMGFQFHGGNGTMEEMKEIKALYDAHQKYE